MTNSNKKERWIQHYKSSQEILLVGEGDFSFSSCLAKAFHSAHNMVATSLDSLETLKRKYGSFEAHMWELEKRGCLMLHEVDVHDMNKHPSPLACKTFDVIIFNFPHAGHTSWLCETDAILIERHKNLLRGFFRSAGEMLKEGGEIHIAHRDDEPYCQWELESLAQKAGLVLKEKVAFQKHLYPGYHNKRGSAIQGNKTFPIDRNPFTFKFCVDLKILPIMTLTNPRVVVANIDHDGTSEKREEIANSVVNEIINPATILMIRSGTTSTNVFDNRISVSDDQNVEESCEKLAIVDDNDVRVRRIFTLFRGCMRCL